MSDPLSIPNDKRASSGRVSLFDAPETKSAPTRRTVLGDALGLAAIAIQVSVIFLWFVPDDGFRLLFGAIAYLVLAAGALYWWHGERVAAKISEPSEWALTIMVTVLGGAVSFGCDILVGLLDFSGLSPWKAATKVGSPFGFGLTLLICPGLTMLAIAGWFRCLVVRSATKL